MATTTRQFAALSGLGEPVNPSDAATKNYVDTQAPGAGDLVGPASATDNAVPRFDTTTGKLLQGSNVIVDDSDFVTGVAKLTVDNLVLDGNTVSSSTGVITVSSASTITLTSVGDVVLNPSGDVDVSTNQIKNVVDPTANQDAATKIYVDGLRQFTPIAHEALSKGDPVSLLCTGTTTEVVKYKEQPSIQAVALMRTGGEYLRAARVNQQYMLVSSSGSNSSTDLQVHLVAASSTNTLSVSITSTVTSGITGSIKQQDHAVLYDPNDGVTGHIVVVCVVDNAGVSTLYAVHNTLTVATPAFGGTWTAVALDTKTSPDVYGVLAACWNEYSLLDFTVMVDTYISAVYYLTAVSCRLVRATPTITKHALNAAVASTFGALSHIQLSLQRKYYPMVIYGDNTTCNVKTYYMKTTTITPKGDANVNGSADFRCVQAHDGNTVLDIVSDSAQLQLMWATNEASNEGQFQRINNAIIQIEAEDSNYFGELVWVAKLDEIRYAIGCNVDAPAPDEIHCFLLTIVGGAFNWCTVDSGTKIADLTVANRRLSLTTWDSTRVLAILEDSAYVIECPNRVVGFAAADYSATATATIIVKDNLRMNLYSGLEPGVTYYSSPVGGIQSYFMEKENRRFVPAGIAADSTSIV